MRAGRYRLGSLELCRSAFIGDRSSARPVCTGGLLRGVAPPPLRYGRTVFPDKIRAGAARFIIPPPPGALVRTFYLGGGMPSRD